MSVNDPDLIAPSESAALPPAFIQGLSHQYTIVSQLGRGGMATVHLARDLKYERDVAIKVLNPELIHAVSAKRFLREIRRTAQLNHPHIVQMLDSGDVAGVPYYVMRHMDGGTLRHRLTLEPRLPVQEAVEIGGVIAGALDYAHRHGLVHRDVKPENILFSEGEPLLADFGIARPTDGVREESLTSRGLVPGTLAYMSPEQASGEGEIDGRSDVFSLGCVLYEMLTGHVPFSGPTAHATALRRLVAPASAIRGLRPDIPEDVEHAVMKALAIDAAERFQTAGELKRALTGSSSSGARWPAWARLPRIVRHRHARLVVGAAVSALAVWVVAEAIDDGTVGRVADTTHIVAFPLEIEAPAGQLRLDDDLMHQALSRWRGVVVADRFAVADAIRRPAGIRPGNRYSRLAETLGAGRYIRGRVTALGDSLRVYAALYDVEGGDALHQVTRTIPSDPELAAAGYADLADALLLRGAPADVTPSASALQLSLPSIQAFALAQRALDDWDLGAADSAFQSAVFYDEGFARAHLWLAQVRAWQGISATRWVLAAERALARADELSERERHLAEALVHLGKGEYAEACDKYAALEQRNDQDFAAWFGLGQCRRMDKAVVPDRSSPSGWRFRSSYHQAVRSYTRAFEILPSVHRGYERGAFDRLRSLFLLSTDMVFGYSSGPDSIVFLGRLGWAGDSLLLVPYPWQSVFSGSASTIPPGFQQATTRLRNEFRRIANGWSAEFPRSAGAKQAVAISLELLGDPLAVDTLRAARKLSTDQARRLELAVAEALLLVKFGVPGNLDNLAAARSLADSLVSAIVPSSPGEAELLAPLAALVGRCALAERWARQAAPLAFAGSIPQDLIADAHAVLARLSMGCLLESPTPSVSELARIIGAAYPSSTSDERRLVEEMLLFRPALLAPSPDSAVLERLGGSSQNDILRAGRATVRRDTAGVRESLTAAASQWPQDLGPPTPDIAYASARMWAAIGDTHSAATLLDRTLRGVRQYDPQVASDPVLVAALIASMVMRADLAAAAGDGEAAQRWGAAVATLRSGADTGLREEAARMSRYARLR